MTFAVASPVARASAQPPPSWLGPPAAGEDHERVVVRQDAETGMRLIVAVHSTTLGPSLGGLRVRAYPGGLREALEDVLALSATMTLKAAAAGLDLGGGKAVLIDDGLMAPGDLRRGARLRAAAAAIDELDGLYVTAEDVGTSPADMDLMAETTRFVVGRSPAAGGAGDPSPFTAESVLRAMEVALSHVDGTGAVDGRRVGIVGLGKVGSALAERLLDAGAHVLAYDLDPGRLEAARSRGAEGAESAAEVLGADLDVLAPCALGGLIDETAAAALDCSVICGAANNPLSSRALAERIARRGILYVPDFMANCGGLVHVAAEWQRRQAGAAAPGLEPAMERLERALALAGSGDVTPLVAAEHLARERIAAARATTG